MKYFCAWPGCEKWARRCGLCLEHNRRRLSGEEVPDLKAVADHIEAEWYSNARPRPK